MAFVGFPIFLLAVRFIMAPMASIGGRSISNVNQLIDEYRIRHAVKGYEEHGIDS